MSLLSNEDIIPDTPIQPFPIVTTKVVQSFTVRVVNLELFTSVTIIASLYDDKKTLVENRTLTISGDEYTAWNNDDSYLINLVASKLGFTLA